MSWGFVAARTDRRWPSAFAKQARTSGLSRVLGGAQVRSIGLTLLVLARRSRPTPLFRRACAGLADRRQVGAEREYSHARSLYSGLLQRSRRGVPWPYDQGDDPAFEASLDTGGRISWGVCRTDVRNAIQPGDIVAFFSTRRGDRKAVYRFVGWATVDEKIERDRIWRERRLRPYRQYKNLLIRPSAGRFLHLEPQHYESRPHKDWLWRAGDWRGTKRKSEVLGLCKRDFVSPRNVKFAKNYVLFCAEGAGTYVIANPPTVATCAGGAHETWASTPFARSLRELLFTGDRDYLRTSNQHRHRHIHLRGVDGGEVRRKLQNLCVRFGLAARGRRRGEQITNVIVGPEKGKRGRAASACLQ